MVYNLQRTEERKVFYLTGVSTAKTIYGHGIYTNKNMEHSRNATGSAEPKYSRRNQSQFYVVNDKSHIHCPRIQIWHSRLEAGN
jgi:hypothetical protein